MKVDRSLNPSLKDYKMIAKGKSMIEYVNKSKDTENGEVDYLDITMLETFDSLKKYY